MKKYIRCNNTSEPAGEIVKYHASPKRLSQWDFNYHDSIELGLHCGSYESASDFQRPYMYACILHSSIKHVPKVQDIEDWASLQLIKQLDGVNGVDYSDFISEYRSAQITRATVASFVCEYLISHNIHAVQYNNEHEGVDESGRTSVSYLLLDDTYLIDMHLCDDE